MYEPFQKPISLLTTDIFSISIAISIFVDILWASQMSFPDAMKQLNAHFPVGLNSICIGKHVLYMRLVYVRNQNTYIWIIVKNQIYDDVDYCIL